jgi:hypothetical protein
MISSVSSDIPYPTRISYSDCYQQHDTGVGYVISSVPIPSSLKSHLFCTMHAASRVTTWCLRQHHGMSRHVTTLCDDTMWRHPMILTHVTTPCNVMWWHHVMSPVMMIPHDITSCEDQGSYSNGWNHNLQSDIISYTWIIIKSELGVKKTDRKL